MLRSWSFQRSLDGAVEMSARLWSKAHEALHELALAIEDECLWNRVLVRKQKTHECFVRFREWILNAEFFRERRHNPLVFWSTDVEADNAQALFLIFLL